MLSKRNPNKKNNALLPIAIIVLCVLVLLLIWIVKWPDIKKNLEKTNFFERVTGTESSEPVVVVSEEKPVDVVVEYDDGAVLPLKNNNGNEEGTGTGIETGTESGAGTETVAGAENVTSSGELNVSMAGEEKAHKDSVANNSEIKDKSSGGNKANEAGAAKVSKDSGAEKSKDVKKPKAVGKTTMELCFVTISADGSVLRKIVKRSVPKNDSPLTTAINLLIAGPDKSNSNETECMNFIPKGSKLLGARVFSNGVAELNFNEAFEFNPDGIEGTFAQLEQVVYTATAFSTVNSVQFLIEGKKKEYLGSEGVRIGSPLSRASF